MEKTPIERAVEIAGSQTALGRAIGVSQQVIWNWLHRDRRIPAEYCLPIEQATGGEVRAENLRPDVFLRRQAVSAPVAQTGADTAST